MLEMIQSRKISEQKEDYNDLFSNLLDANNHEGRSGGQELPDSELLGVYSYTRVPTPEHSTSSRVCTGNIFIFLIAGHETTAHTLCFTLALLALYSREQEALYKHIREVIPDDRLPVGKIQP